MWRPPGALLRGGARPEGRALVHLPGQPLRRTGVSCGCPDHRDALRERFTTLPSSSTSCTPGPGRGPGPSPLDSNKTQ